MRAGRTLTCDVLWCGVVWCGQAMYTWLLLPLLPINWHFMEFFDLVNLKHMGRPISKVAATRCYGIRSTHGVEG